MSCGGDDEGGWSLADPQGTGELKVVGDVNLPVGHNPGMCCGCSLEDTPHGIAVGAKRARELKESEPCVLVHKRQRDIGR